jgi:hypothetical protein
MMTLTQQEGSLITSSGIATWARLVNGDDVTALYPDGIAFALDRIAFGLDGIAL